jgi:hypothetical protein
MLLGYTTRNAISPKVSQQHIDQFQKMSHAQDKTLPSVMSHYHNLAGQIASRIEGLDPDRRRLAHDDLNQNLLAHVATALKTGKTARAVAAIGAHLKKLAQQHGVAVPPGLYGPAPAGPAPAIQSRM